MSDESDTDESQEDVEESSEEVEFEEYLAREAVVDHFESFLEAFREGETVSLTVGEETIEFEAPDHLEFEVEYEEYEEERELEFELEWQVQTDDLDIEPGESTD